MDSKTAKELFIENNKEIADCGIKVFSLVVFPLAVSTMKVTEHIREDYNALEFIVLRLIDAGVSDFGLLCKATGLTERMIKNIVQNEIDYNHIEKNEDNTYTVLEGGKITLADQSNILDSGEYINHKCYEKVPRDLQFDVITGTVLAGARKYVTKFNNYAFDKNENIFNNYKNITILEESNSILEISDEVKRDIVSGLYSNYPTSEDITVEEVSDIFVDEIKYAFAYYVVTEKPKMNILVIRTQKLDINAKPVISYEPISIPSGFIDNPFNKYIERSTKYFEDLVAYENIIELNGYDLEDIIRNNDKSINEAVQHVIHMSKEDKNNP